MAEGRRNHNIGMRREAVWKSGSEDQPHLSGWRRNCKVGDGTERDEGYISQTLRGRSGCLYGTI